MAAGKMIQQFTVERLGQVQTWTLRSEPFSQHRNLRRAYVRGFTERTEDFNQGLRKDEVRALPVSKVITVGDAYERGYADALNQEPPSVIDQFTPGHPAAKRMTQTLIDRVGALSIKGKPSK